jgi:alpha-D-xyloside xylohydrolase
MKTFNQRFLYLAFFGLMTGSFHTSAWSQIPMHSPDKNQALLNEPFDISGDFRNFSNAYFLADSLSAFDPSTGKGKIKYHRYEYFTRQAFNNMLGVLRQVKPIDFPEGEYAVSPELPLTVSFVSPRTIRIRANSRFEVQPDQESLMLVNGKAPEDRNSWVYSKISNGHKYTSPNGSVIISECPWRIEIFDASGKLLTRTFNNNDGSETLTPVLPFSFVRRALDYSTSMSAAFTLSPDEKIFGCGESFTEFNKRGQKIVLWADDATEFRMKQCTNQFLSS